MVTVNKIANKKMEQGEQKDRRKTLAEFPDHILNDYDYMCIYVIGVAYDLLKDICIYI